MYNSDLPELMNIYSRLIFLYQFISVYFLLIYHNDSFRVSPILFYFAKPANAKS